MSQTLQPSPAQEEYEAIEAAVMETARGRWFLAEFLRRNQSRESRALLAAVHRLEDALLPAGTVDSNATLAAIRDEIKHTASELARIAAGDESAGTAPGLTEATAALAAEAAAIAAELERLGAETDDKAASPQGQAANDAARTCHLALLATRQRLLAERLALTGELLTRIAHLAEGKEPPATDEPELNEDNLAWFSAEEDMFTPVAEDETEEQPKTEESAPPEQPQQPEQPEQSEQPEQFEQTDHSETGNAPETSPLVIAPKPPKESTAPPPARRRIVVIRKSSSEEMDIPFAKESTSEAPAVQESKGSAKEADSTS